MPKPLAEIVTDAGLLSQDKVVDAARKADSEGEPLVVTLVRRFGVDELALVAAVRKQTRVALSDPATMELEPDALRELSRDACRRLRAMPVSVAIYNRGPKLLRVAMADPTDPVAIAELEHLTGCRVEVSLTPLSAVEEMIENSYRQFVTEVMAREPAARVAGLAREPQRTRPLVPTPPAQGDVRPPDGITPSNQVTEPYHRLSDEAHITLRHQALLQLLLDKRLISEDEYEERVRQLMKAEAER